MLNRTCLWKLGCMTDNVNTVAEPKTQCNANGLLRATCWVEHVWMHHIVEVAWQMTSAPLRSQRRNAMILGCWGWRLGRMCLNALLLLGRMTNDVSTVAEPKTRCHDIGLLRLMCWVRCAYMHRSGNMNCWVMKWYWICAMTYVETMNSIRNGLLITLGQWSMFRWWVFRTLKNVETMNSVGFMDNVCIMHSIGNLGLWLALNLWLLHG